jgi:hypothetical protein
MTPNCGYGVGGKDTPDTVTEGTEQHSNTSWGTEYRSRAGENLESNVREKKKKQDYLKVSASITTTVCLVFMWGLLGAALMSVAGFEPGERMSETSGQKKARL